MSNSTLAGRRYSLGLGLFTESVKFFAGWILAAIVLAVVVPFIVSQWNSIEISAWAVAANVGKYLVAIIAGGYIYTLLPITVAQGMTRREYATSMGVFGLLWSLMIGALAVAGFLGERALYGALDWTQAIQQGDDVQLAIGSFGDALEFAAVYPLAYLLYFTAGAVIGAAIYRSDGGWLVLVPVIPVTLLADDAMTAGGPWGPGWLVRFVSGATDTWSVWVGVAVTLVVIVTGALIARRIIIDSPIRPKQA
ncbi:hypothetical protein [Glycomyces tenuis]|uniref:hypothetical protein n=1 Tax=Glycomyces tenuis TaxID=58116 RepID=UPI0004054832|nr:hypothetical protein [Glycomyces tenuis]